jgi:predicted ATPase
VAAAVGLREEQSRPLLAALADFLRPKHLLLVLDNCEHLLNACAALADALLRTCPHAQILATSRQALGIAGETAWRVPSLPVPAVPHRATVESVTHYEAVRLFIERAVAAQPHFRVTNATAGALAQVCQRLDGIPLAIELAAARVTALSVEQIAARLDQRFRLLTGGSRTALPRQQTLRALVDWSYELLASEEQLLFNRLSTFAGGFTLEAAEAVCAGGDIAQEDVLDLLVRLVDKSLVAGDQEEQTTRYSLLETLRQYGQERLAASGETARLREQHGRYYLKWAEAIAPALREAQQTAWLARLARDYENVRTAVQWWAQSGDTDRWLRLAGALGRFWEVRGLWSEGRALLSAALAASAQSPADPPRQAARARALQALGALAFYQQEYAPARACLEESLALYRGVADAEGAARVLLYLGWMANDSGQPTEARALVEESLTLCRQCQDRLGTAWALARLGLVGLFTAEYAAAETALHESVTLSRRLGDRWGTAWALQQLTMVSVLRDADAIGTAEEYQRESQAIWRELGDRRNLANSLGARVFILLEQGDVASARPLMQEALTIQADLRDQWGIMHALLSYSVVAAIEGQPGRALRLEAAATALHEATGATFFGPIKALGDRALARLRQVLSEQEQTVAHAEGQAMTLEQAIAYALEQPEGG